MSDLSFESEDSPAPSTELLERLPSYDHLLQRDSKSMWVSRKLGQGLMLGERTPLNTQVLRQLPLPSGSEKLRFMLGGE